ncbi:baculoviral IAP repeat-containing protein 3-like [Penaeus chinensis]|uniref:baculoviral IAP repeat-containing protein 3-like n=1 Tax=Penaeus chinensis TaxID=139456 RepID=UPI001FB6507B|nr:baculoviral IAP repeat-containing protein 3-like [Penaeus chinensis]
MSIIDFVSSYVSDINYRPCIKQEYSTIEKRLASFEKWPDYIEQKPQDLAEAGFYYKGVSDRVYCFYCNVGLCNWQKEDIPWNEHAMRMPSCPYVFIEKGIKFSEKMIDNIHYTNEDDLLLELDIVKYVIVIFMMYTKADKEMIRITEEDKEIIRNHFCHEIHRRNTFIKQLNRTDVPISQSLLAKAGFFYIMGHETLKKVIHSRAIDFTTKEKRVASFRTWPENVHQKPQALAEAGFYYKGLSDHVHCFHCDGIIRNWEKEDIPWNEHAKWYPNCNHLILEKGKEFVNNIQDQLKPYNSYSNKDQTISEIKLYHPYIVFTIDEPDIKAVSNAGKMEDHASLEAKLYPMQEKWKTMHL